MTTKSTKVLTLSITKDNGLSEMIQAPFYFRLDLDASVLLK